MGLLLLQVAKEHGRQLESAQEELAIIRAEKAELAVRTDRTTLLPKPCLAFLIRVVACAGAADGHAEAADVVRAPLDSFQRQVHGPQGCARRTPIASVLRSVRDPPSRENFVQALSAAREQFGKDLAELAEKSGAEAADASWAAEKRNFEAQLTETKAIVGELRGDIDEQQLAAEQLRALVAGADGATS